MKSLRALFSNMLVLGTTSQGNKTYPRILIHIEDSRLSFLRLSFAFLLIGVFWMVVQLDQYVVWWRSGEKALLLVAVIVSTILICINDRMYSDLRYKKREIEQLYWIATSSLLTMLVIHLMYLTISEPPPIIHHTGWPDHLPEVPGPRRLKVEGVAIIFLLFVLFGAALGRARIQKISKYLPIYITVFGIIGLLARLMSLVYYTCSADFSLSPMTCHGSGIWDIGGTTLNAIHAVQKGINPYTVDIQDGLNPDSPYRGFRYWPMMIVPYMPLAYFVGQSAIRLTNFGLDVITAVLIAIVVGRRSGWPCGVLATSLYLMLPMVPDQLYMMAATDLVPMVFLLGALALYETRPGLAGMMVGLSVSAKFIPGLLMLVCCFPEFRRSRYLGGFLLGLIPAIAFCLPAPSDFISNTVSALLRNPFDPSSWLYGAPFYMISATRLAFFLLIAMVSLVIILRPPGLFERCAIYVICVVALLLASQVHNNYMLWWIPFFCIVLSSPLSRILALPGSLGNVAASGAQTVVHVRSWHQLLRSHLPGGKENQLAGWRQGTLLLDQIPNTPAMQRKPTVLT